MNKTILIGTGLLLLLLTAGVISNGVGWEMTRQSALAQDDGPALGGSPIKPQQDESNEQAEDKTDDETDPASDFRR